MVYLAIVFRFGIREESLGHHQMDLSEIFFEFTGTFVFMRKDYSLVTVIKQRRQNSGSFLAFGIGHYTAVSADHI